MSNLKEPTTVTIPLDTAIRRTASWRAFLAGPGQVEDTQKIPKAVYISRADIEALATSLQNDDTLTGVRAYFTLNSEAAEIKHNDVKFCMVLVRDDGSRGGKDVIFLPGAPGGGDDDSNVYDFTKPCPDYCDPSSPLYGGDEAHK